MRLDPFTEKVLTSIEFRFGARNITIGLSIIFALEVFGALLVGGYLW